MSRILRYKKIFGSGREVLRRGHLHHLWFGDCQVAWAKEGHLVSMFLSNVIFSVNRLVGRLPRLFAKRWLDPFETFIPPSQTYINHLKEMLGDAFYIIFTFFSPKNEPPLQTPGGSLVRKRKTLSWPESDAPEFLCVAFSAVSPRRWWRLKMCKQGSKRLEVQVIYTYNISIHYIYSLLQSFATQTAQDLKWNLKK